MLEIDLSQPIERNLLYNSCVVWCGVVWCGVVWCGVVWWAFYTISLTKLNSGI